MRLAEESQARLERFFQSYLADETIRLPPIFIHAGFCSRYLTRALRVAAITFGTHILVSSNIIAKDNCGRAIMPGWLLAHEVAHVRQYQAEGLLPFVFKYVREYLTLLCGSRNFSARGRMAAYERLAHEREAREVETAYQAWHATTP